MSRPLLDVVFLGSVNNELTPHDLPSNKMTRGTRSGRVTISAILTRDGGS